MRSTWLSCAVVLASLPLFATACGGQVSPGSSAVTSHPDPVPTHPGMVEPAVDSGAPDAETILTHSDPIPSPDGGSCVVVASSYSAACTTDSDCVAVPIGGDTCDPCSAGSGDFECPLAAINVNEAAGYNAAVQAALAPLQGTSAYNQCVISSCPVGQQARCQGGTCVLDFNDSIPDSGQPLPAVDAGSPGSACVAAGGQCYTEEGLGTCGDPLPEACGDGLYCCTPGGGVGIGSPGGTGG